MSDPFEGLPRGHFAAVLADPPWHFQAWVDTGHSGARLPNGGKNYGSSRGPTYQTMRENELKDIPVSELAARDSVLFLWGCWPVLEQSLRLINAWGFTYKTCGFCWMKADQYRLFALQEDVRMGLGYWTRANSEFCLLSTRGKPKRINPDVRQGIIEPLREHSRKPDCVHERIERLVAGPYLELFARQSRPGWTTWGNETTKFDTSAPKLEPQHFVGGSKPFETDSCKTQP
jgi:N6-adenosine-specific RNA methylase IME4